MLAARSRVTYLPAAGPIVTRLAAKASTWPSAWSKQARLSDLRRAQVKQHPLPPAKVLNHVIAAGASSGLL